MVTAFVLAVLFTISISFFCSMLEALILSTTVAEIESLKRSNEGKGKLLEELKADLPNTISAILTLNTIANTAGSTTVGGIASFLWGEAIWGIVAFALTIAILIFSEVIPKNLGVIYRIQLQPFIVRPLTVMKMLLSPFTYFADLSVRMVMRESTSTDESSNEEEIILLAEKGAKDGTLTSSESNMVTNALKLDEEIVGEIMTPRVVVTAISKDETVDSVFTAYPNVPFARIPVFDEEIDNIVGIVRRRDLLTQKAEDKDDLLIAEIMDRPHFIPETVTVASALQAMLRKHQQLLIVVDEFGSLAGVVTMEDIMEYILGREIYEADDMAIDMREFAREESLRHPQQEPEPDGTDTNPR